MARTTVPTDRLMRPIAEFSMGLRVGDVVYVGATAGTDARRELAGYGPGRIDVEAQSARMFANMATALELLGGRVEDVVRVKGYVDDVRDFAPHEEAAKRFFKAPYPSQMTVGSWGFPLPQAVVEADLVAIVGGGQPVGTRSGLVTAADAGAVVAGGRFYGTALPADRSGDVARQAESGFQRLAETLAAAGLALADVVMLTVTLADIRVLPRFDDVYGRLFRVSQPARTVIAVPLPAPDVLVSVECIAVKGGGTPVGDAMLAGDTLYIGGQTAPEETGIEAQTTGAWKRVERLVAEAGMSLDDVVSTTNVLADWRDYRGFNAGFGRFVRPPYPPRTTLSAGLADPAARVQVEAIAHRDGRNAQVIEVVGS
jgi:enamine deaminase RidA (YjgF/YER057c/UK114 family)